MYVQCGLYLWLGVFWSQPHKEERFLFPAYPLISLAAAITIDSAQKLAYFLIRRTKANHYLKESSAYVHKRLKSPFHARVRLKILF